ncbi:hypothetical protein Fcan01_24496 [Folsomia candida]|uniref:Uncharacterized protein n=1 Tax=Folsomia candida TaxID=158441 RepID=A0A226D758_FOLCA|nr:hypothetical protein Fcan01_24496 [Folsomia candida]
MDVSRSRIFIGFKYSDNLTTAVNLYKQIFLLVGQINFCFCQIVLPAILIYGICINILGTYLSVKLNSKLFTNVGSLLYPSELDRSLQNFHQAMLAKPLNPKYTLAFMRALVSSALAIQTDQLKASGNFKLDKVKQFVVEGRLTD